VSLQLRLVPPVPEDIPLVAIAVALTSVGLKRWKIRDRMNTAITEGLSTKLRDLEMTKALEIRPHITDNFNGVKQRISKSIDEEIGLIAAGLQTILDRTREKKVNAEEDHRRFAELHAAIWSVIARLEAVR
jgi:hypothetical protein